MDIAASAIKNGTKLEINNEPYNCQEVQFVKPGKGQAFVRCKIKNLKTKRVVEKTYKSHEKLQLADVEETKMRLLYVDNDDAHFMDDDTYDQIAVSLELLDDVRFFFLDEQVYDILLYKNNVIGCSPPNFLDLKITETEPGLRGDTTGKVLKPGTTETGGKVQIPLFIEEGEVIRIDTRTNEYAGRSN